LKFSRVQRHPYSAQDLIDRDGSVHHADFSAVLRGLRRQTNRAVEAARARHVLNDDLRVAWDEVRQVGGNQPAVEVISAAGSKNGDEGDGLLAVEFGDRFGPRAAGLRHAQRNEQRLKLDGYAPHAGSAERPMMQSYTRRQADRNEAWLAIDAVAVLR
jgi:hypothetical protein